MSGERLAIAGVETALNEMKFHICGGTGGYPERLFLPTMPGHGQLEVTPCGGGLEVKSGSEVVADLCYWNAGWGPVRSIQISGNCGTALVSRGTAYRASPGGAASDVRSFYFWRVRTLHRKGGFDTFDERLAFGVTFV